MAKNVNRTARLQWKVDTIKNCIYLQCGGGGTLSFVSYLQYGRISSSFSPQFIQPTQSTKVPFVLFSI